MDKELALLEKMIAKAIKKGKRKGAVVMRGKASASKKSKYTDKYINQKGAFGGNP